MTVFPRLWTRLSISKKLYTVVGVMALLLAGELLVLRIAMDSLSALRGFVGGEALWSKGQKNAAFSIQRYALTRREEDFQAFLDYLKVPEGDHLARVGLMQIPPDTALVRKGFLQGQIHSDDIDPIIRLIERFSKIYYVNKALAIWGKADEALVEFKAAGIAFHNQHDPAVVLKTVARINQLNVELTLLEDDFSKTLGEGSRAMERLLLIVLAIAVMTVETFGIFITFRISRSLSKGLRDLNDASERIGHGEFAKKVPVQSEDELGTLAVSVNKMGDLLQKSYSELETRVEERTGALSKLVEENARLVQTRDEFISVASHELRTPMTALALRLQLLSQQVGRRLHGEDASIIGALIGQASDQTRRLSVLSGELLDLTQLKLGSFKVEPENCDLRALVFQAVSQLSAESARSGVVVSVHSDGPVSLDVDPIRIVQVITNLVSNAIKYGQGKPVDVTVGKSEKSAHVEVRDNGLGIPKSQHTWVFERYQRGDWKGRASGLGLGLFISRQIVEAHQGSIILVSEEGAGASFQVVLPLAVKRSRS